MKKFFQISAWFLMTLLIVSLICAMLNEPNTLVAIAGFVIAVVWIAASVKTKCFTHMPFHRIPK